MRATLPETSGPVVFCGFAALQVRAWLRQASQAIGIGRPVPLDLEALNPPDSALARRAEYLAREAYDGDLHGHASRTWAYGRAVGLHLGLPVDPEALYVACLLHDVGLTEKYSGATPFELRGAEAAHAACQPDQVRADLAHDAIAMHTSLGAGFGPPEMRLVQSGSGGDLVGLDKEFVHPETHRAIVTRWPKSGTFSRSIVDALKAETAPHPRSPGAALLGAGFAGRIRAHHRGRSDRASRR